MKSKKVKHVKKKAGVKKKIEEQRGTQFECPVCGKEFNLNVEEYAEGDALDCKSCGVSLVLNKKGNQWVVAEAAELGERELPDDIDF